MEIFFFRFFFAKFLNAVVEISLQLLWPLTGNATSYLCSLAFLTELRDNEIDGKAELMEQRLSCYYRAFGRWRFSFSVFFSLNS